jgi:hypothetical protein
MSVEKLFLDNAVLKLRLFTDRIGVCLDKLTEDQIWARGHENENAVGNLVLHLNGNLRQWIVSGLGGKPDIRIREQEFAATSGIAKAELTAKLRDTVGEAATVISGLTTGALTAIHKIQDRQPTGVEAVASVVEHFAQHTGQIIFATKNLTGQDLGLAGPKKPSV